MDANTFWSSLEKPDGDSGCWIWTKSKTPQGYGRVYYPPKGNVYTHRLAYELVKGPISEGLHVCHACDNPPCCNPAHLWLGTAADNVRDRDEKGRAKFGCRKLQPEQVVEMRRLYKTGEYLKTELGAQFNVHPDYVRDVVLNRIYIDSDYTPPMVFDNGLSADKNSIRAIAAYRSGAIKRVALGRIHTVQQLKLLELLHRRAEIARQAGLSDDDIFKAVA